MTGPNGEWDDTRLDAAFRSRYEAAPPSGLADRIATELEAQRPAGWLMTWRRSTLGLVAAAAIVVVALIGSQIGIGRPGPGASGPGPSGPQFSSPPMGAGESFPPTVIQFSTGQALPVLSVAEAAFVRDAGVDAREIAVGGWYVPWQPIPCPMQPDEFQPLEGCYLNSSWLLGSSDAMFQRGPNGPVPALHPVTDLDTPGEASQAPKPVVFIGHFDDARAANCPAGDRRQACAGRFVVDQVAWTLRELAAGFPTDAAGLPVTTVDVAISVREMGMDTEIAVGGWYQPAQPMFCDNVPEVTVPLLEGGCSRDQTWFMDSPESLIEVNQYPASGGPYVGITSRRPTGTAANVSFAGIPPPPVDLPVSGGSTPKPVVFIGHFHDRRANLCATATVEACGRIFVVDAVAWVDGATLTLPILVDWRDNGNPAETPAQLQAATSFLATHTGVLSTRLASSSNVLSLEPALGGDLLGDGPVPDALTHDPLLWLATIVEQNDEPLGPVARTYIIDSNGVLYRDGGPTFIVVGPTPT